MNVTTILQILSAGAALYAQAAPMLTELRAALEEGDQSKLEALLARLQADNDRLGTA